MQQKATVIAEGLKIVGSVSADGLVEVHGQIEGEIHCPSLVVRPNGKVIGSVQAQDIVVEGSIDGPIHAEDVALKATATVTGDIECKTIAAEKGAVFEGRLVRPGGTQSEPRAGNSKPALRALR